MMINLAQATLLAAGGAIGTNSDKAFTHYWLVIILMMTGLYLICPRQHGEDGHWIKPFQAGVILFYVSMGRIDGGTAPIITDPKLTDMVYSNPLPHVLMLTAILLV